MSWLDPIRAQESREDLELRGELRELLGLSVPSSAPSPALLVAEVSPELVNLAEQLRHEAWRRRRTRRPGRTSLLAIAAILPFLLVLGGTGLWGVKQKGRADALALALEQQKTELAQQLVAVRSELDQVRASRNAPELLLAQDQERSRRNRPRGPELVIPVNRQSVPPPQETVVVKGR